MSYLRRTVPVPIAGGFNASRRTMLAEFVSWIADSDPTPDEIGDEIDATVSAMMQLAEVRAAYAAVDLPLLKALPQPHKSRSDGIQIIVKPSPARTSGGSG
jgi:hypothetical protein